MMFGKIVQFVLVKQAKAKAQLETITEVCFSILASDFTQPRCMNLPQSSSSSRSRSHHALHRFQHQRHHYKAQTQRMCVSFSEFWLS